MITMQEGWYKIVELDTGYFDMEYFEDGKGIHAGDTVEDFARKGYEVVGPVMIFTREELISFVEVELTKEKERILKAFKRLQIESSS